MNLRDELVQLITKACSEAVAGGALPGEILSLPVKIEYPRDSKFGDYATPLAMEAARLLRKSPIAIAEALVPYISKDPRIGQAEAVKPGFINIFISHTHLYDILKRIGAEGRAYGRNTKEKPRRINLEFVSANPTGPMVIVSARAAALGDSIANLFEASGDTVEREFYVNDYGNQVTLFGKSVLERIKEIEGKPFSIPEDGYHGEYVRDIARYVADTFAAELAAITDDDGKAEFCARRAIEHNVEDQRKDLEEFNVRFNRWFNERVLHESGDVERAFATLEGKGYIAEEDGKKVFLSSRFGDDKDRVVVREDGRPTYLMADIAYHNDKVKRGYDLIIDIWGPDHHGYIARLSGAMQALGFPPENFKILIAQQVNLLMEGVTVKMSKRLGRFSTMKELVEEIGVDVARYFFTIRSLESHLDFDLALAKKESSENPVFYLQYAHARICSIFREAEKRGIPCDTSVAARAHLDNPESEVIMKLLARYPEEISDAAETMEPHRIGTYLMKLAQSFHRFYVMHRVLTDDREASATFMLLSDAVRYVMESGLALLGVSAPEQM